MTRNLTLLTDFYQLTMMNGYLKSGVAEETAVFDLFFRQKGQLTYAVAAGLEQAINIFKTFILTMRISSICALKKFFRKSS